MIEGVNIKKLTVHKDERGQLFEILRSDEEIFESFGQTYITVCNPGWIKGWHYHRHQTDFFCVVRGKAKIVLVDWRENSPTYKRVQEYLLSDEEPYLLRIPNGVLHGFQCLGETPCWILNHPTRVYNSQQPDEYRYPLNSEEIPYTPWKKRKGY